MVIALDRSSAAPNLPPVLPDKVSGPPFGLGVVAGPVSLCPHGISEQAIYAWRKRFGGFQANDVRRLRQLEAENDRLKKTGCRTRP
jgi:hypothetical protein